MARKMIESLQERITGRYLAETVYDAEGNMLVKINHMVTPNELCSLLRRVSMPTAFHSPLRMHGNEV